MSTTTKSPGAMSSGVLSFAPTVWEALTAIPSIAAESNGGEDRVAQIGSAVTRPMQSPTGTTTVSTRAGQPAASQHRARPTGRGRAGRRAETGWCG